MILSDFNGKAIIGNCNYLCIFEILNELCYEIT